MNCKYLCRKLPGHSWNMKPKKPNPGNATAGTGMTTGATPKKNPNNPKTMQHTLKIWQPYFDQVKAGLKTFELRRADRAFAAGDTLLLREYNPQTDSYTGNQVTVDVLDVLYGIAASTPFGTGEFCIMSIRLAGQHTFTMPTREQVMQLATDIHNGVVHAETIMAAITCQVMLTRLAEHGDITKPVNHES